jgi:hypothetical protein
MLLLLIAGGILLAWVVITLVPVGLIAMAAVLFFIGFFGLAVIGKLSR